MQETPTIQAVYNARSPKRADGWCLISYEDYLEFLTHDVEINPLGYAVTDTGLVIEIER